MAYQSQPIRFGLQGLVLKAAHDLVTPTQATVLTNLYNVAGGTTRVRQGQTLYTQASGVSRVHTLRRMNASGGARQLYAGIDNGLFYGVSPVLLASGFSGNPLSLVPYRSELAGDFWLYVGDSNQMLKVRSDGVIMPIGLAAPTVVPTATILPQQKTVIDSLNGLTGWHAYQSAGTGTPLLTNVFPPPPGYSIDPVGVVTTPGVFPTATALPYDAWIDKAISVDLTQVGTLGAGSATDSDYIHLWMYVDHPESVSEVRLYFVTSPIFTTGIVPGTSTSQNNKGYFHSFPSSSFASALAGAPIVSAADAAAFINAVDLALAFKPGPPKPTVDGQPNPTSGTTPLIIPSTNPSLASTGAIASGTWTEYGILGTTLYRSDFTPFGNTSPITLTSPNGDWSHVTGIVIWISVVGALTAGASSPAVLMGVDDCYLYGGYGLDDGPSGDIPYNWVYTNYDPRTGAESNLVGTVAVPTPTTPNLDVLRGAVTITPAPYGNSNILQRFYRLGGSLTDNWYFTGTNTSDGGTFLDTNDDSFVEGTGQNPPLDHFQPIATVNASGTTVLAQPVPALWGPLQGMLFACGDPYRPGWLYTSKPNEPDHWINAVEVCSGSEALMHGCVFGDQVYVFSTERAYHVLPNLSVGGGLTTLPTACTHGLASRWGLSVGVGGIYFVSRDGIFHTTGTDEGTPISDDLRPLFGPVSVGATNGYYPIDFTVPSAIRLAVIGTDLWFGYQDINGSAQWMIYSLLYTQWTNFKFTFPVATVYLEEGVSPTTILLGETTGGNMDFYSGITDRGTAIPWSYQSGALDQGYPHPAKRYGNWCFDIDAGGGTITAQAFVNDFGKTYPAQAIPNLVTGRQRYYVDPWNPPGTLPALATTVRDRSVTISLIGSSLTGTPILYLGDISFEVEPAEYITWDTNYTDHGIADWQVPLWCWIKARGQSPLLLTRVVYDDRLNLLATDSYTITLGGSLLPSHAYVVFYPVKGALFHYHFSSPTMFKVYPSETTMAIQPITGGKMVVVRPFDTTDVSALTQGLNPLLAAMKAGGSA
jgi:hypothetical protein